MNKCAFCSWIHESGTGSTVVKAAHTLHFSAAAGKGVSFGTTTKPGIPHSDGKSGFGRSIVLTGSFIPPSLICFIMNNQFSNLKGEEHF